VLGTCLLALLFALPAAGSTPGGRILFDEQHGSSTDLVEVDADATDYANLTPGDQTFYVSDSEGSWSPDGSRIVFTSHRDSNVSTEIYVMNADGSNQQRLTHDGPQGIQSSSTEIFDSNPVWSPAGNAIAYLKSVHGAVDVWMMRPDGSDQHALTGDGGMKSQLAWAPGGARLTYEVAGTTFAVPASGGSAAALARGVGLTWSPDGSRFAYVTGRGSSSRAPTAAIHSASSGCERGTHHGRRTARELLSSEPGSTRSWRASSGRRPARTSTRSGPTAPTCAASPARGTSRSTHRSRPAAACRRGGRMRHACCSSRSTSRRRT
jgi:Dipeptidyl peptidase IV (DPP IV) N-terminal region/WD40-like Beta Propeller Repeat